ncbi:MAG TPA: phosphoglucosamine mutase, partial [Flavobacteriales bacterium]|nr:phosphoglucosamine mutase [Flavobacteriales bacterium]
MTLIKSISGIRGTIGGVPGDNLTPIDVVRFVSAFGTLIKQRSGRTRPVCVVGWDARLSGPMVGDLVRATLTGLGFDVIVLGLATTPTVEMAVPGEGADAGIILTASHNPAQW